MLKRSVLYSLRDICTIPTRTTDIESRKECNIEIDGLEKSGISRFPLIVAPMSCVLSESNWKEFRENKINVVIPRTVDFTTRIKLSEVVMCAFSLKEAKDILLMPENNIRKWCICLDMANGHMKAQIGLGSQLRDRFKNRLVLMGGNIANPETYSEYNYAGFDYVRVGIGGGNGCLTSTQTSINYPMASLLNDMVKVKKKLDPIIPAKCKIVADGGISCYSDIIKCFALGADFVMMGRVFSQAALKGENIGDPLHYYGMSTTYAQTLMGASKDNLKTSEGKFLDLKKEYTLSGWVENFSDYLRSAMSYCDSRTLSEFTEKSICHVVSQNSSVKINDK